MGDYISLWLIFLSDLLLLTSEARPADGGAGKSRSPGFTQELSQFLAGLELRDQYCIPGGALQGHLIESYLLLSNVPGETLPCLTHKTELLETLYLLKRKYVRMLLSLLKLELMKMVILAVGSRTGQGDELSFLQIAGIDRR